MGYIFLSHIFRSPRTSPTIFVSHCTYLDKFCVAALLVMRIKIIKHAQCCHICFENYITAEVYVHIHIRGIYSYQENIYFILELLEIRHAYESF